MGRPLCTHVGRGSLLVAHPAVDASPAGENPQDVFEPKVVAQPLVHHLPMKWFKSAMESCCTLQVWESNNTRFSSSILSRSGIFITDLVLLAALWWPTCLTRETAHRVKSFLC